MDLDAFLYDFVKEVRELDPNYPAAQHGRRITVSIRCWICDAPMRATLKGITGHGGYFGCERCLVRCVTYTANVLN